MISGSVGVKCASVALTASALMIVRVSTKSAIHACVRWIISADELVIEPIPPKKVIIQKADEMFQSSINLLKSESIG